MRASSLALILLLIGFAHVQAGAAEQESVWSALVLATKSDKAAPIPKPLAPFAKKLAVFGYNQFEIVGSHTQEIDSPESRWLLPSEDFYLGVTSRKEEPGKHRLHLQFYQGKRLLVETDARVGEGSPLFIRGPLYGNGQLIVVVVVR
jgi:hypothetical protein